ncbi:hypothetical protein B0H11DRAFT_1973900 [Mycena galericulata]|nr:hypothetical protein B0H11DRAFT_1973900 [Mycena galericulata]
MLCARSRNDLQSSVMPAHYDADLAHSEFSWIDTKFVPNGQSQETEPDTYVAATAIPHLTVRFQGIPVSSAPRPPAEQPSLTLRLNGVVRAVIPRQHLIQNDARPYILDDGYRLGRSKPLTPFQKQFKAAWRALQKSPISDDADKKYITRVDRWTCTCKGYKFHACYLCKHLVQAVPSPPMRFWNQVVRRQFRRRTVPLHRHPDLTAINAEMDGQYIEPLDGSITDGDDHA